MKKIYTFIILHLIIYNLNNAFAQCTNPTISLNLPDTTIAFKQDSILLDAGAGYTSYSWNTGATTRFLWAKFDMKYKVTVTSGNNCGSDSTTVILLKGIEQINSIICAGSSINLSIPGSIPTNGLVGWWPFNGNANDLSGNSNNGSVNGAQLTTDRNGKLNSAYSFNGVSNNIDVNSLNNMQYSPVTYSCWFTTNDLCTNTAYNTFDAKLIIGRDQSGTANQGILGIINQTAPTNVFNKLVYWTGGGGIVSRQTPSTNEWHNLIYSYETNGKYKYYYNGILIDSGSSLLSQGANIPFKIGSGGGRFFWNGKIDDIGIWNRALNANEITNLYSINSNKISWSTNDTTNSITVSPNTSTTYYCDITVGSYTFRDSIRINVRNFPNKNVSYTKLGLCKNDTIALSANIGYSYNWFKNDSIVSSLQTLKVAEQGAYRVALTDSFGCKNTSDTLHIINAPLPNIQFVINDTAQCLKENMFSFKDSTLLDSGTYNRLWNFGSSNTSTQMDPSFNFAAVGTYPIKLQINTNYGCKDSLTKTVTVLANPTAGPMLGETNALSVATPYIYTVAQQPNHTYNWVVSNGIIASGQGTNAATVQWLNNGKGNLKAEVTNTQGCIDTTATQVTIGNVGLNDLNNLKELMVYPNPSNGTFAVSFDALKSSTVEMSLVNLLGQQIWDAQHTIQAGEQSIQINANLAPGVYTLRINNLNEQVQHKVIIK